MPVDDATQAAQTGAEGAPESGTAAAGTEDPTAKVIEDYRRRQAGAEKARQEAERQRDEFQRQLESYRSSTPAKKSEGEAPDLEAVKRELQADFNKKLAEEVAKVTGSALDARFPTARAKFPTVTDAVQLAELEALFTEAEPPTVIGNNQQKTNQTKNLEDMTAKEIKAYMLTLDPSAMGLRDF